ncbi:hypothetical protein BGZ54_007922 [Gamsiella multidivaricata]|nr:hypothetical protein BGZ54_007922 [Gamsiella multidivaricata]
MSASREHYDRTQTTAVSESITLSTMSLSDQHATTNTPQPPPLVPRDSMAISIAPSSSLLSISTPVSDKDNDNPKKQKLDTQGSLSAPKTRLHAFLRQYPWLMGWNHEDWWPCWIGLFLFALIAVAVHHNIPSAHFEPWTANPFDSLHGTNNLDLLVLFPLQGLLVWLALWAVQAKNWSKFYRGFFVIYSLSFLSKWLAAQRNVKSASLGDSIWAILFGTMLRNIMAGAPLPDGRSKALPPWLKVAQQTELYIAISLVLLWYVCSRAAYIHVAALLEDISD